MQTIISKEGQELTIVHDFNHPPDNPTPVPLARSIYYLLKPSLPLLSSPPLHDSLKHLFLSYLQVTND